MGEAKSYDRIASQGFCKPVMFLNSETENNIIVTRCYLHRNPNEETITRFGGNRAEPTTRHDRRIFLAHEMKSFGFAASK